MNSLTDLPIDQLHLLEPYQKTILLKELIRRSDIMQPYNHSQVKQSRNGESKS